MLDGLHVAVARGRSVRQPFHKDDRMPYVRHGLRIHMPSMAQARERPIIPPGRPDTVHTCRPCLLRMAACVPYAQLSTRPHSIIGRLVEPS